MVEKLDVPGIVLRRGEVAGMNRRLRQFIMDLAVVGLENTATQRDGLVALSDMGWNWITESADRGGTIHALLKAGVEEAAVLLGQFLYERLPEVFKQQPLPSHYFDVFPHENVMVVQPCVMSKTPGRRGMLYQATGATVEIDGDKQPLFLTRHFLERFTARSFVRDVESYAGMVALRRYVETMPLFEITRCRFGEPHLVLYQAVGSMPPLQREAVQSVDFGHDVSETDCLLIGYAPIALEKDAAVLPTCLLPGHLNTPEYWAIKERSDGPLRGKLRREAETSIFDRLTGDMACTRWCHENEVPQIKTLARGQVSSF